MPWVCARSLEVTIGLLGIWEIWLHANFTSSVACEFAPMHWSEIEFDGKNQIPMHFQIVLTTLTSTLNSDKINEITETACGHTKIEFLPLEPSTRHAHMNYDFHFKFHLFYDNFSFLLFLLLFITFYANFSCGASIKWDTFSFLIRSKVFHWQKIFEWFLSFPINFLIIWMRIEVTWLAVDCGSKSSSLKVSQELRKFKFTVEFFF